MRNRGSWLFTLSIIAILFFGIASSIFIVKVLIGGPSAFMPAGDTTPPGVIVEFETEGKHIPFGYVSVRPNQPVIPLIKVKDDQDPFPTIVAWLTQDVRIGVSEQSREQKVISGEPLVLESPGLYHLLVQVTDKSGNVVGTAARIDVRRTPMLRAAAVIEHITMEEDRRGIKSVDVTILFTAASGDISQLDRSHLVMFPIEASGTPIPSIDWDIIPETEATYLPQENAWRVRFEWSFSRPLDIRPRSFLVSCFVGQPATNRWYLQADTMGIKAVPDAMKALRKIQLDQ